jgi:hypothetical protein
MSTSMQDQAIGCNPSGMQDDHIARVKETRTTLLQLHVVQRELHNKRISLLRNKRLWYVRGDELRHAVDVAEKTWWEERLSEAMLGNQP